eukprot:scaffold22589_cov138-Cylindrotheca_fusiformis.AAC.31
MHIDSTYAAVSRPPNSRNHRQSPCILAKSNATRIVQLMEGVDCALHRMLHCICDEPRTWALESMT